MESVSEAAVDSILQEIPECLVDANYYYYKNFRNYYNIYHKKDRFKYYISIGSASQGPYYVATFAEHLLVTRVGVRTSINRRIIDSVSFEIAILAGNNPYDGNKRSTLDAYLKFLPLSVAMSHSTLESFKRMRDWIQEKLFGTEYIQAINWSFPSIVIPMLNLITRMCLSECSLQM